MDDSPPQPLALHREWVRPDWIDYNGHMNMAYYLLAFDHATDAVLDRFAVGETYRRQANASIFARETHVTYERELNQGDPLAVTSQILGADTKRLHLFHQMYHGDQGYLAATNELMILHVDLGTRRSVPFPAEVAAALQRIAAEHVRLPRPVQVGRAISLQPRARPPG
jgi:acyl-CoA thioester hydrolase